MSTKQEVIDSEDSCLNKADSDEPVFVLRASDPLAPMVVRMWASLNGQMQVHLPDRSHDAWRVACSMEEWRVEMYGPIKYDFNR